jgi:hypothetical protein
MSTLHLRALKIALDELIATGDLTLAYMATTYTPDDGSDQYWSDISAQQAAGTADEVLTNVVVGIDTVNNRVTLDADNPSQSPVTATTDKFTLRVDTGSDATSPIVATIDVAEGTLNPVAGTLSVTFNAAGIFALTSGS